MTPAEQAVRVYAASEAASKFNLAIEGERRRAERRARAGGGGRRVGEREHLVAGRSFRVVNGKCAGLVVPEDDTVECPECDGRGYREGWGTATRFPGEPSYVCLTCAYCAGIGRLLGIPDQSHQEPQRLVEVRSGEGQQAESRE